MGWFHNIWDDVLTWTYRNHTVPKVGLSCYNNDWLHDCCRRLSSGFNINKYLPDGLDIWVPFWCWSKHVLLPIRGNLRPVLFKASLLSQWDHFLREWCRHTLHGSYNAEINTALWPAQHNENLCWNALFGSILCYYLQAHKHWFSKTTTQACHRAKAVTICCSQKF